MRKAALSMDDSQENIFDQKEEKSTLDSFVYPCSLYAVENILDVSGRCGSRVRIMVPCYQRSDPQIWG